MKSRPFLNPNVKFTFEILIPVKEVVAYTMAPIENELYALGVDKDLTKWEVVDTVNGHKVVRFDMAVPVGSVGVVADKLMDWCAEWEGTGRLIRP